jgi:ribose transport system substrate-binding protein
MVLDNRYEAETALKNADEFVKAGVDLVIEFQIDQHIAPLIANRIAEAGVPLIAVDIPHPHATYFGVDNFRVGLDSGVFLAEAAKREWNGVVDWVLGLDIEEAGPLVQSRITGCIEGIRSVLPAIPQQSFVRIDSRGLRDKSKRVTADFLKWHPGSQHILIASSTDSGALGALEAAQEAGRTEDVLIVGHDCIPEMVEELQDPESPIVGTISSEVSAYGPRLMELAISLLQGKNVPPYNYVQHRVVARSASKAAQKSKKRVYAPTLVEQKKQARAP